MNKATSFAHRRGEFIRPKRTANKFADTDRLGGRIPILPALKASLFAVCLVLLTTLTAWAFDPPRIIGELYGNPDSLAFGTDFCWVGDQNGDGFEDLMISRGRNIAIYFGAINIDNSPDFVFQSNDTVRYENELLYLGKLTADNDNWFLIGSRLYANDRIYAIRRGFYKGGNELDTIPEFTLSSPGGMGYILGYPRTKRRPADFNGDGYDDFIATYNSGDYTYYLVIFDGGETFDTIPDWSVYLGHTDGSSSLAGNFSTGCDINNDGCDDFILKSNNTIEIFLGGNPMDTVAYMRVSSDIFEPRYLVEFAMLPDVNGDGYDDWGFYWVASNGRVDFDGYYLFFGSEEPDFQYDVELESNSNVFDFIGNISCGDFNGDGFGDIITVNPATHYETGEMRIYWGRRDFAGEPDIAINTQPQFGNCLLGPLGAIGDYNGDGIADFVSGFKSSFVGGVTYKRLYIFSKGDDWVSVPSEKIVILPSELGISISPNPFNQNLNIQIDKPIEGEYLFSIADISGRQVWQKSVTLDADTSLTVTAQTERLSSGIYFVRCLHIASNRTVLKKAVLLR